MNCLHMSYQKLLSKGEAENDEKPWFEVKMAHININGPYFLSSVTAWLSDTDQAEDLNDVSPCDSISTASV